MPEPDDPLVDDLAGDLMRSAEPLIHLWHQSTASLEHLVSPTQLRVLLLVDKAEEITMSRLTAELGMLASSSSRLCDRLEAAGFIRRHIGQADRRLVTVRLAPTGRRLVDRMRAYRRSALAAVLATMTPSQRHALQRGLTGFGAALQEPATRDVSAQETPVGDVLAREVPAREASA